MPRSKCLNVEGVRARCVDAIHNLTTSELQLQNVMINKKGHGGEKTYWPYIALLWRKPSLRCLWLPQASHRDTVLLSFFKRAYAQQVDCCRAEWRLAFEKSAHLIGSLTPVSPLELTKGPGFLLLPSHTHTDLSQASCAVESSGGLWLKHVWGFTEQHAC